MNVHPPSAIPPVCSGVPRSGKTVLKLASLPKPGVQNSGDTRPKLDGGENDGERRAEATLNRTSSQPRRSSVSCFAVYATTPGTAPFETPVTGASRA